MAAIKWNKTKQFLFSGLTALFILLAVQAHPAAVFAWGQWIATEKIWDDGRLNSNETFTWSGGYDQDGHASGEGVLQ